MYYKLCWKMKNGEERTRIFTTMKEQEEAIDIIEARTDVDKASIYQQSSESEFKIFLHPELIKEEDQEEPKPQKKERAAEILEEIIELNENEKIREKIKHDLEEPQPKRTEAQKRAEKKYLEKFDDIKIRVPKGMKEEIKYLAKRNGLSMNEFFKSLIEYARYCDEIKKIEEEERDRKDAANDIIPE